MNKKITAGVWTVVTLLVSAVVIHEFVQAMGWQYSQWNLWSMLCVYAGICCIIGSAISSMGDWIKARVYERASVRTADLQKRSNLVQLEAYKKQRTNGRKRSHWTA